MPVARFQLEDGRIARFEVPEGTTPEEAQALIQQFIEDQGTPTQVQPPQQSPPATPAPSVEQEGPGIGTLIAGAPEVALSMVTGAISEPIAGLAGALAAFTGGADAGADAVRSVQEAGTFQPRSEAGQQTAQALGQAIEPLGELISSGEELLGGGTLEATGSPALAAAAVAVPTAILELFGLKAFRAARKVPRGPLITPDGVPTPELETVLKETGGSFEDLTKEATDFIATQSTSTDPAQVARAARFEAQGIPATRGDISQEFAQQASEAKLISAGVDEAGEPLRQFRLDQSEVFKSKVNELVDSLGVPADVGVSVKEALTGRKDLLTSEKNALYRRVTNAAPEVANIPLLTDSISDALPDKATLRRLSRQSGSQVAAVKDLLVEFGVDKDSAAVKAFGNTGGEVTPLALGNFEEFRQALGQIERADQTGAAGVVTGPIRRALDEEAGLIDAAIKESGIDAGSVLDTLKDARSRVRTIKTEFSPQAISGRLIDTKRDGVTPVIEASRVSRQLLSPTAPIEDLKRTLQSLSKAGKKGGRAIKDLQASVILNALEDALNAPSRKTSGIQTIGGNQFAKSLEKFGDDKLDLLFKGNPKDLARLRGLKQTARDITPTSGAVPKGSAPVIMDMLKRTGRVPGLAPIMDAINLVVKAGADDRAVARALRSKPEARRILEALERDFPSLAVALAIPQITPDSSSEQVESN